MTSKTGRAPVALELLAPARDAAIAVAAIDHGADAVYIGAAHHGARTAAGNSLDDIRRVVSHAHTYGARVYVTLNTIIYDDELDDVSALVHDLWRAGVDALIVQDMALIQMDIPPIALHASTQCDIRDAARARFLADAGFSQIVLARELSLAEIAEIRRNLPDNVTVEAFVHGALCVSYSGDCQAGQVAMGRSANRGECPQFCRLPYDLYDGDGNRVIHDKHLLSLRDMCRIGDLRDMADAGVSSFKIEGRLKDAGYVKNVVSAYRRALDAVIDSSQGRYRRASQGRVELAFTPDVGRSFNRGFTSYFLRDIQPRDLVSADTPKMVGTPAATVVSCRGTRVTLRGITVPLNNGDGIAWFDRSGRFDGVRVNRAEARAVITARPVDIAPGTLLYRNYDKAFADTLAGNTATRRIPLSMTLRSAAGRDEGQVTIALDLTDDAGRTATASIVIGRQTARTQQHQARRNTLSRLGDTAYSADSIDDRCGDLFIPASQLAALRRHAIAALQTGAEAGYRCNLRRPDRAGSISGHEGSPVTSLTYHANVANRLAERFYRLHGVSGGIATAIELDRPSADKVQVMETRYCLRRQLGACLRDGGASRLPGPLTITTGPHRFMLDFDCARCRMHVSAVR